jgi:hypothetical protein
MVSSTPQGFVEPDSVQRVGFGRISSRKSKAGSQEIPCSIPDLKEGTFRHTQHQPHLRFSILKAQGVIFSPVKERNMGHLRTNSPASTRVQESDLFLEESSF